MSLSSASLPAPEASPGTRPASGRDIAGLAAGRCPRWFLWVGLIALAGYAAFLGSHSTVAAGGSDSSGYLNSARLLTGGKLETPTRLPPGFAEGQIGAVSDFQPLGFAALGNGSRLVPTYPSGLPLHFALTGKLLGWPVGILLVGLASAVGAVWLCYAIGRELGLARSLAVAAAMTLAACPLMLYTSIQPLSDTLATTWCLAAMWSALRARRQAGWAVACGAAYGIAILVRPTNALLLPALLVVPGLNWRRVLYAMMGGLPAAGWLAYYNHTLYGGPLRSGYFNWSEFFALQYLLPAGAFFTKWLIVFLPAILLVLPLAAFCHRDVRQRELYALVLWFSAITGLYLFCSFSHESWTCLRYILPGLPAVILAGMLGVEAIARTRTAAAVGNLRLGASVLIAGWAIVAAWIWAPSNALFAVPQQEDAYRTAAIEALARLPERSLLLSCHHSGSIYFYTDFPILRWDAMDPQSFARYATAAEQNGVTMGALLFADEEDRALRERCPGEWTHVSTVDGVSLWRLAAPSGPPRTAAVEQQRTGRK